MIGETAARDDWRIVIIRGSRSSQIHGKAQISKEQRHLRR